ncbi:hypothetical protein GGH94_003708 [Coemansia aciculifera]|uniref:Uncharacterized protein n=1 Tax=Coemansia aciculifera TaxID=417176 RepID=A0A9W8IGL9_9FUNG|nr:hypothetical protein GGH94_003708 [Coemansia aciculifera]
MPNVSEIRVHVDDGSATESDDESDGDGDDKNDDDGTSRRIFEHFGNLVTQLFQLADRVWYDYGFSLLPTELRAHEIHNLAHIEFHSFDRGLARLVRQNAPTLQSLKINLHEHCNMSDYVADDKGVFVQYPCLHRLDIDYRRWVRQKQQAFSGAVPFPNLRRLLINGHYPFDDDTLFRGNEATLEHLDLTVEPNTLTLFRDQNVLTPTRHSNLRFVKIFAINFETDDKAALVANTEYLLGIGRGASERGAIYMPSGREILRALTSDSSHACIQALDIRSTKLGLFEMLTVIKVLPLLSDLHSMCDGPSQMPYGNTQDSLPAYIRAMYAPMGQRFRCWHSAHYGWEDDHVAAECALLLALACPNLDYIVTPSSELGRFMDAMEQAIALARFQPYAPRLHRLLIAPSQTLASKYYYPYALR